MPFDIIEIFSLLRRVPLLHEIDMIIEFDGRVCKADKLLLSFMDIMVMNSLKSIKVSAMGILVNVVLGVEKT